MCIVITTELIHTVYEDIFSFDFFCLQCKNVIPQKTEEVQIFVKVEKYVKFWILSPLKFADTSVVTSH